MNDNVHKILGWVSARKRQFLIAVISLGLIGGICAWEGFAKDIFFPKNFGVVEPGQIYRSGKISPFLIGKVLTKYNIKVIITLSGDSETSVPNTAERKAAKEMGIERLVFSISPFPAIPKRAFPIPRKEKRQKRWALKDLFFPWAATGSAISAITPKRLPRYIRHKKKTNLFLFAVPPERTGQAA
jgi:hypothetical protein